MAALAGAFPRVIEGRRGLLDPEAILNVIAPDEYDMAPASLLILENSHNHAGGTVMDIPWQSELHALASRLGIRLHLDGARVFNAATALGVPAADIGALADSVMFCLSKGLGAPVGSMLCGPADFVEEARIGRKRLGGGMRQVGILAAAGLYALEHNVERLADDHRRAGRLAEVIADLPGFTLDPADVKTTIVIAGLEAPRRQDEVLRSLAAGGVLASAMGPGRVRFVTHLDVDDAAVERAIDVLRQL
jgi:threonine aldolase